MSNRNEIADRERTALRSPPTSASVEAAALVERLIGQALAGLRYGELRLVVQDGVVVQLDRLEKKRLR